MAGLMLLSGCATAPSEPIVGRVVVKCGTVIEFAKADLAKAAAEIDAMPADSVLANKLIPDYGRMRAEARACAKS